MKQCVFKIEGMHCTSCAMDIDGELEDTKGVKEANTSYAKQLTKVTFDESLLNEKKIIKLLNKIGYEAVSE